MNLQKHIRDSQTGIAYTLVGDYYLPDFSLGKDEEQESLGKYGNLYLNHIKKHNKVYFNHLVIKGTLYDTVKDVENQCCEMLDRLIEQMSKKENVTEKLKEENQLLWLQKINNIKNRAEEIVLNELIYS